MSILRLIGKEITHRKLNFALGVLSVFIATGCLVAAFTLLRGHDLHTEELLRKKEAESEARLLAMEDDYRIIMKAMGFNILILPEGQNLSDFWAEGYATKTMPEEYVTKLASSKIVVIRHLLPILEQKIDWPEQRRKIILVGTRGEVPFMHRDPKSPILVAVPPGSAVLGYELWNALDLNVGDTIALMGKRFTVSKCHEERGSVDDITIWTDLAEAQALLEMPGRINVIQALKCICSSGDMTAATVREEVTRILPGTHVRQMSNIVIGRQEARDRARIEREQSLAAEAAARARLRETREAFAAALVPLVLVTCAVWVGLLAFANVRERRAEIGILRAIGLRSRQIFSIFIAKALFIGMLGACLGYAGGFIVGAAGREADASTEVSALFSPGLAIIVLLSAPLLSAIASWAPAMMAGRQDPAIVLREE